MLSFKYQEKSVLIPEGYSPWLSGYYAKGHFYEQEMLAHISAQAHGGTFIDVGANAGNHSLFFAKFCGAKVHAFEPNVISRTDLEKLIALNGMSENVVVHPIALSDHEGTVEATFVIRKDQPNWTQTVPCQRLDDIVTGSDVKIIKIDVEGAEPYVLRGATRILRASRPKLYVEANDKENLDEIMAVVGKEGYALTGKVFNVSPTYEITFGGK